MPDATTSTRGHRRDCASLVGVRQEGGGVVWGECDCRPQPSEYPRPMRERNAEIARLYADEHWTMPELAARYGISTERVRQILENQDVPRRTPAASQALARRRAREQGGGGQEA